MSSNQANCNKKVFLKLQCKKQLPDSVKQDLLAIKNVVDAQRKRVLEGTI